MRTWGLVSLLFLAGCQSSGGSLGYGKPSRAGGLSIDEQKVLGRERYTYVEDDKLSVSCARKIQRFLSQPFHVAETFTNTPGVYVEIKDTIKGFEDICQGRGDDLPEQAFYMQGTLDDVRRKAEQMAKS